MMKRFLLLIVLAATMSTYAQYNWNNNTFNNTFAGVVKDKEGVQIGTYSGDKGSVGNMVTYTRLDLASNDIGWKYDNGKFVFTSNYVWTDFFARVDPKSSGAIENSSLNVNDIVEFGYYKITDGVVGDKMVMFAQDGEGNFTTKNTVIFENGDTIGIYAKINEQKTTETGHYEHKVKEWGNKKVTYVSDSKDGYVDKNGKWQSHTGKGEWVVDSTTTETVTKTYTTTDDDDNATETVINNVDHDSRGKETQYFCLFTDGFSMDDHFEYYLAGLVAGDDYNQLIDDVIEQHPDATITNSDGSPATTSGQPLPGLLVTLAIGGTVLAGVSKKRKKSRA